MTDAATAHSGTFGSYVRSFLVTTTVFVGRCRDILPMLLLKTTSSSQRVGHCAVVEGSPTFCQDGVVGAQPKVFGEP